MQRLSLLELRWSDELPFKEEREWHRFIDSLEAVKNTFIDRCIVDYNAESIELHASCDASEKAYDSSIKGSSLGEVKEGIEWNFIPPSVPHMGGNWKASIKSVKYPLKRSLGISRLTYEEFETVIIQVEGILNSRPLTLLSNDFDNLEPFVENNKGNSGSSEKMEYRLSEHSPTENKVDDGERQYNVWNSGNCKGGFYTSSQLAFRSWR
ncbi:DUF5641 domain-containing protein [Trichonephila clavipes]|nr:DUF5641 domain-containing protein [Trichonephila clavipes]